MMPALLTEKT